MRRLSAVVFTITAILFCSCSSTKTTTTEKDLPRPKTATVTASVPAKKTFVKPLKIDRDSFVTFAKTLLGTPYKYGSAIPENGLDCSGFVTCVFGHFNIKSPRTTVAFTNEGHDVDPEDARPGDLILFTGSDNSTGIVGHMGIITSVGKTIRFIHSASGKNIGVILNDLTGYYKTHFVKLIRILE